MPAKNGKTRIMIFGTFDRVHPGHRDFFRQARKLARKPFLIASIGRDRNVFKIKGKYPDKNERERARLVKKDKFIDQIVLGGTKNHLPHILKAKPDIIALGYDQRDYVKNLKKDLKNKGLNVKIARLKPYREKIYKTSLMRKKKS